MSQSILFGLKRALALSKYNLEKDTLDFEELFGWMTVPISPKNEILCKRALLSLEYIKLEIKDLEDRIRETSPVGESSGRV